MSAKLLRATFVLVIVLSLSTASARADRAQPREQGALMSQILTLVPEEWHEWVRSRIGGNRRPAGPVRKCSGGIDPNGRPCALPSAGCTPCS